MAINKVTLDGNALIDLTQDTVTADSVKEGVTFHDKKGESLVGTLVSSDGKQYGYIIDFGTLVIGTNTISESLSQEALEDGCLFASATVDGATMTLQKLFSDAESGSVVFSFSGGDGSGISTYMLQVQGTSAMFGITTIEAVKKVFCCNLTNALVGDGYTGTIESDVLDQLDGGVVVTFNISGSKGGSGVLSKNYVNAFEFTTSFFEENFNNGLQSLITVTINGTTGAVSANRYTLVKNELLCGYLYKTSASPTVNQSVPIAYGSYFSKLPVVGDYFDLTWYATGSSTYYKVKCKVSEVNGGNTVLSNVVSCALKQIETTGSPKIWYANSTITIMGDPYAIGDTINLSSSIFGGTPAVGDTAFVSYENNNHTKSWTTIGTFTSVSDSVYQATVVFTSPVVSTLDLYPVGAYYITENATSPASMFGGEWVRVTNKFLYGATAQSNVGTEGGEATHTLTYTEMPVHSHRLNYNSTYMPGTNTWWTNAPGADGDGNLKIVGDDDVYTAEAGDGTPHNNIPPYRTVNIWRRIS